MNDQKESPNTPPKPNLVTLGAIGGLLIIVIAFAMTGRGGTEDAETIAKYIAPVAHVEMAPAPTPAPAAPAAAPSGSGDGLAAQAPPPAAEAPPPTAEAAAPAPATPEPQDSAPPAPPQETAAATQPAEAAPKTEEAAPAATEEAATPVAAAGNAEGKAIYNKICVMCHSTGVSGAPKFGDKAAWAPRIAQGEETLVKNAIAGKKLMPAKGGSPTLTNEQVQAAVEYMVSAAK